MSTLPPSAYDQVSGLISEKGFQSVITELAEHRGWFHHHTPDSRRSTPGFPDLVLIKPPKVIFLEVKREKARLSVAQADVLAMLWGCNEVQAAVVRPSDWSQVVEWLSS